MIRIEYNLNGRAFFHADCINHFGGIMREESDDPERKRTLFRCLHCGEAGYYPHGRVGEVVCESATDEPEDAGSEYNREHDRYAER